MKELPWATRGRFGGERVARVAFALEKAEAASFVESRFRKSTGVPEAPQKMTGIASWKSIASFYHLDKLHNIDNCIIL